MNTVLKNKREISFSLKDIKHIKRMGLSLDTVEKQLSFYRQGSTYLNLNRACSLNDGILSITSAQRKKLIFLYEKKSPKYKLMKFVPASGAASRMFAEWFSILDNDQYDSPEFKQSFLHYFKKYPFYFLIKHDKRCLQFVRQKNIRGLLDNILSAQGLNYGWLPKALIPFHLYGAGNARTAMEEHIFDAAQYVRGARDVCHLHFTVSKEHKRAIVAKINSVKSEYENKCSAKYKISISFQLPSTNMLAVDNNNLPLRDKKGNLIFRPGGHGALLENMNKLNADFIFIRNIDNVAPQPIWQKIIPYRKMMGGLAIQIQEEIHDCIRKLKVANPSSSDIKIIQEFCSRKLNIDFSGNFKTKSPKDKIEFLFSLLNRPLRVCGVVKNNKEPGGGPFWVEEDEGTLTLQIVENAHVDKRKKDQTMIWSEAQYFNPVDMVCSIKDYRGKLFNLSNYVNNNSYTISIKNEKGVNIKALEIPGLWNGSMANWNTVFVKLPLIVFNPVKTVDDLLRPEHLIS